MVLFLFLTKYALRLYKKKPLRRVAHILGARNQSRCRNEHHLERVVIPYANSPLTLQKYESFSDLQIFFERILVGIFEINQVLSEFSYMPFSAIHRTAYRIQCLLICRHSSRPGILSNTPRFYLYPQRNR